MLIAIDWDVKNRTKQSNKKKACNLVFDIKYIIFASLIFKIAVEMKNYNFVFQTLARGLVMWDSVLPSFSYLQDNIPKVGLMVIFL